MSSHLLAELRRFDESRDTGCVRSEEKEQAVRLKQKTALAWPALKKAACSARAAARARTGGAGASGTRAHRGGVARLVGVGAVLGFCRIPCRSAPAARPGSARGERGDESESKQLVHGNLEKTASAPAEWRQRVLPAHYAGPPWCKRSAEAARKGKPPPAPVVHGVLLSAYFQFAGVVPARAARCRRMPGSSSR